jgi:hypothetical protein
MSYESYWNFYQVSNEMFPAINFEFASAYTGIKTISNKRSRTEEPSIVTENIAPMAVDSDVFFHAPFADLDYRISREDRWRLPYLDGSSQLRVLPTVVLFYGIGQERFLQIPGHLGNMLIHSSDIEQVTLKIRKILTLDREAYFQKARKKLWYSTGWNGGEEEREDVFNTLDILPNVLAQAQYRRVGIISLVTREFWSPSTLVR